jgi:hypothetical protein
MAAQSSCGMCNQSFESDRDLKEHQQREHAKQDRKLPESERDSVGRDDERDQVA